MEAMGKRQVETVKELVKRGARLDDTDNFGFDAMKLIKFGLGTFDPEWLKTQEGHIRQQKVPQQQIDRQVAALYAAHTPAIKTELEVIQAILVEAKTSQEAADRASPLFAAIRSGRVEDLKRALDGQSFVDPRDGGQTPLIQAVLAGREDMVALLLDKGASPGIRDSADKNAREYAKEGSEAMQAITVRGDHQWGLRRFRESVERGGMDPQAVYPDGETILMQMVASDRPDEARILIECGARLDVRNKKGQSLADVACTRDNTTTPKQQMLDLLMDAEKRQRAK